MTSSYEDAQLANLKAQTAAIVADTRLVLARAEHQEAETELLKKAAGIGLDWQGLGLTTSGRAVRLRDTLGTKQTRRRCHAYNARENARVVSGQPRKWRSLKRRK